MSRLPSGTVERLVLATLVVLAAVLVAGMALPGGRTLVVKHAESGERLLSVPVQDGSTIAIEYTHSVERTRVVDAYVVEGDRLTMTRMTFESYGWGLPADADVRLENGTFVTTPEWSGTALYVNPGAVAGHRLSVNGDRYDLVALSDGEAVRLSVTHHSALETAFDTFDQ